MGNSMEAEVNKNQLATFMSTIVHQLKTPLSAAKLAVDVLAESGNLNETQIALIKRTQVNFDYMLILVHELLDVAWFESGADLVLNQADLVELVSKMVKQFESYAPHRGVTLTLDVPDAPCWIRCDVRRIEGVISNLISNAIKYSPKGGLVLVSLKLREGEAVVRVEDHGIGIAPEYLPHIFERYFRVRNQDTKEIEGDGLGLAFVKAVVERHGGQVTVESTFGQGSVFEVTLPRL